LTGHQKGGGGNRKTQRQGKIVKKGQKEKHCPKSKQTTFLRHKMCQSRRKTSKCRGGRYGHGTVEPGKNSARGGLLVKKRWVSPLTLAPVGASPGSPPGSKKTWEINRGEGPGEVKKEKKREGHLKGCEETRGSESPERWT